MIWIYDQNVKKYQFRLHNGNQQYVTAAKEVWNTELLILHVFQTNAYDKVILFILTLLCTGYYLSQAFYKRSGSKS